MSNVGGGGGVVVVEDGTLTKGGNLGVKVTNVSKH